MKLSTKNECSFIATVQTKKIDSAASLWKNSGKITIGFSEKYDDQVFILKR